MPDRDDGVPRVLGFAHDYGAEYAEQLKSALELTPGDDDAQEKWATVALASVISKRERRARPKAYEEAFDGAPLDVRMLVEAAAYHDCSMHLGQYQLRALDLWIVGSPEALGERLYENATAWGGSAGKRVRETKRWCMPLGFGMTEALLAWSPGDEHGSVAQYTSPLAGVADSERTSALRKSLGGWILDMLGWNVWDLELKDEGIMHPTFVKRHGWHNDLEEVWQALHAATVDEVI